MRDAVHSLIDFEGNYTASTRRLTASEVLLEAGVERPTMGQAKECGSLLRAKFGAPTKVKGIFRWTLPIRKQEGDETEVSPRKSKFD